jgi:hypothetical protein
LADPNILDLAPRESVKDGFLTVSKVLWLKKIDSIRLSQANY